MSKFEMRNHVDKLRRDGGKIAATETGVIIVQFVMHQILKSISRLVNGFLGVVIVHQLKKIKEKFFRKFLHINYQLLKLRENSFIRTKMELH